MPSNTKVTMREIVSQGDWLTEFSLQYFEGKEIDGKLIPPISSKIGVFPHQFKARALFESEADYGSLLIADEVGLGKTYSAAHIIHHMVSEGIARRVLVLSPARLAASKWKKTLRDFRLYPELCKSGKGLKSWLTGESNSTVAVSSFDKADESGVSIDEFESLFSDGKFVDIDLLVVDEIHNFVGNAEIRIRLLELILVLSRSRIGITATPIWNSINDFSKIYQILTGESIEESEMNNLLTLQGKLYRLYYSLLSEDVDESELLSQMKEIRKTSTHFPVNIKLGDKQARQNFASRVVEYCPFNQFMTRTISKEVFKSRKRHFPEICFVELDKSEGEEVWSNTEQKLIKTPSEHDTFDKILDNLTKPVWKLQTLSLPSALTGNVKQIADKMASKGHKFDTQKKNIITLSKQLENMKPRKLNSIIDKIREITQQEDCRGLVVFTQWIPTFKKLKTKLEDTELENVKLFFADPEYDWEHITSVQQSFQHYDGEKIPVILVTRIFREGLDLFRANNLLNIDLVINPLEIEQRIGRIDRMGQESDDLYIHYILLDNKYDVERLRKTKEKMKLSRSVFGEVNPILPEDIGWTGKIHLEDKEYIEAKAISNLLTLNLPNAILEKLSHDLMGENMNKFRKMSSDLVVPYFTEDLFVCKPVTNQTPRGIEYNFSKKDSKEEGKFFWNKFLTGSKPWRDSVMSCLSPDRSFFSLRIGKDGYPVREEIRKRTVELLLGTSPKFAHPPSLISNKNGVTGKLFRFSCEFNGMKYQKYLFVDGDDKLLPANKWMDLIVNVDTDYKILYTETEEVTKIIDSYKYLSDDLSSKLLQNEHNRLSRKLKSLNYYLHNLKTSLKSENYGKVESKIGEIENKISSIPELIESKLELITILK